MKRTIAIISLLIFCGSAIGQSVDDFRERYEKFREDARKEYDSFRDSANARYAAFLAASWKEMKLMPAIPKPKEKEIKPVIYKDTPIKNNPVPIKEIIPPVVPAPSPKPIFPIEKDRRPKPTMERVVKVFGTEFTLNYSSEFAGIISNNTETASLWLALAGSKDVEGILSRCCSYREDYALCDWAYLNFCLAAGDALAGAGSDNATVLAAYILSNSGFNVRLAKDRAGKINLLFACQNTIYSRRFIYLDGLKYYPVREVDTNQFVSEARYDGEAPLSLDIRSQQKFASNPSEPRLCKASRLRGFTISVSVNKNLVDFYSTYPTSCINDNFMTRWAYYANAHLDESVSSTLYPALRSAIAEKSVYDAADLLLNFVHSSFPYGYDSEIWGSDRAFFCEESIFYPKSDCEDHAILYSRLVRDLLKLPVVLVYYPGHIATAVAFPEEVKGDYVIVDGRKFTVCDPTYFGSHVGSTMSGMDNSAATVILLDR